MKTKFLGLIIFLSVFACKDQPQNEEKTEVSNHQTEYNIEDRDQNGKKGEDTTDTSTESPREIDLNPLADIEGNQYLKTDQQQDTQCNCYCLELNLSGTTELCLVEDEIYINARLEKSENEVKIFYAGPSERNTNEDLPWEQFDKKEPLAVITPISNGNLELDWKGFTIDGELAVDYAIYGKKTLEGTYSKR